ncbi:MAG TPA: biotin/lipoyl-containing protein [Polyangiaceae bacterium]|nr:biotin/lipoyl-containing protein [Polyangiaceae bacterium]
MRYVVSIAEQTFELDVEPRAEGGYLVRGLDGRECIAESLDDGPGLLSLRVDGQTVSVLPADGEVRLAGERYAVRAENWQKRAASRTATQQAGRAGAISATMPGRIVGVLCAPGAKVAANTPLIVIEAMKMQNELCAKSDAVVRAVLVEVGQTVERGALLVEFE